MSSDGDNILGFGSGFLWLVILFWVGDVESLIGCICDCSVFCAAMHKFVRWDLFGNYLIVFFFF